MGPDPATVESWQIPGWGSHISGAYLHRSHPRERGPKQMGAVAHAYVRICDVRFCAPATSGRSSPRQRDVGSIGSSGSRQTAGLYHQWGENAKGPGAPQPRRRCPHLAHSDGQPVPSTNVVLPAKSFSRCCAPVSGHASLPTVGFSSIIRYRSVGPQDHAQLSTALSAAYGGVPQSANVKLEAEQSIGDGGW